MTTIMDIPVEIIEIIMKSQNITIEDVRNFNSTCKKFQRIYYNDEFWRKKFSERWPSAKRAYDKQTEDEKSYHNDFINHIKAGMGCIKKMWHYISCMPKKHYYYNDIHNRDIEDFNSIFLFHNCMCVCSMNVYILIDELVRSLFAQSPRDSNCDLTQRYYSIKILHYLLRYLLTEEWKNFTNQPKNQQLLEKIAIIMMQWYRPDKYISFSYIEALLDNIAQAVLKYLKQKHPEHSIFLTSAEQFSFWKHNNINNNYWNETETKQIKYILDTIIFNLDSYGFDYPWIRSDQEDIYLENLMRMDIVSEVKIWKDAFLLITYHSVARRLGVHCELVNHIGHYNYDDYLIHIAWNPSNRNSKECFYIKWLPTSSDVNSNNLPTVVQKKCQISPQTCSKITLQAMTSLLTCVNITERIFHEHDKVLFSMVENNMKTLLNSILPIEKQSKKRSKEIKFAVGMIVIHNHDQDRGNNKAGVIIGWNDRFSFKLTEYRHFEAYRTICKCSKHSEIRRNEKFLPYYLILSNNDEICYVAQSMSTHKCMSISTSNITICHKSKWIKNTEIGRYFCRFENTYYVPNEMLAKHYPSDAAIILDMISKQ